MEHYDRLISITIRILVASSCRDRGQRKAPEFPEAHSDELEPLNRQDFNFNKKLKIDEMSYQNYFQYTDQVRDVSGRFESQSASRCFAGSGSGSIGRGGSLRQMPSRSASA